MAGPQRRAGWAAAALSERLEQPPVGQRLGVPLHADREAAGPRSPRPCRRRRGRAIRSPPPSAVDRLVVEGVDRDACPAPIRPRQPRAGQHLDLVGRPGAGLALAVARQVLVQRAAAGDVERLRAAADAQQRHPALDRRAGERELEGVQRRLGRPELARGARARRRPRGQVRAAGEADAVEAGDQRLEVRHARRQHDGHPAGALDRLQVGHPQRHLRVGRLALAAQGRRALLARSSEVVTPISGRMLSSYRPFCGRSDMAERPNRAPKYPPQGRIYPQSSMSSQYIFTMYKLCRTHPPDKQVLKDISLSFLPGAKIGVLGLNGSGKSTLLRIMAGQDTEYRGEAQLAPGATVGLLEQEPQLDESKDVRGNVEEGVARAARPARPLQRARRQLLRRDRRRVRAPAGADRRGRRLEPRHPARHGDGRAAPPARRRRRHEALRRRAPPRRALPAAARARPTCCCSTSRPTTSTRSRSRWLERHLEEYKGTVVAVTHDRYFLDNVAGWILELDRGHGLPFKGNYSSWLEQKQARLAQEERKESARQRTIEQRARVGAREPEGPPQEGQGAPEQLRAPAGRGAQRQARPGPDPHPGRASGSATR